MNSKLDAFLKTRGFFAAMNLTSREADFLMKVYRPHKNNAPSLQWVGHFKAYGSCFTLCGRTLERIGEYDAILEVQQ